MKIYYNRYNMSKTTLTNQPFDLLVNFFDTEIGGSSTAYRTWLATDQPVAGGNMHVIEKNNGTLRIYLQTCFANRFKHDLVISKENFVELLDTWDNLRDSNIHEIEFIKIDNSYNMQACPETTP